jgi:hypothetical protein
MIQCLLLRRTQANWLHSVGCTHSTHPWHSMEGGWIFLQCVCHTITRDKNRTTVKVLIPLHILLKLRIILLVKLNDTKNDCRCIYVLRHKVGEIDPGVWQRTSLHWVWRCHTRFECVFSSCNCLIGSRKSNQISFKKQQHTVNTCL